MFRSKTNIANSVFNGIDFCNNEHRLKEGEKKGKIGKYTSVDDDVVVYGRLKTTISWP